VVGDIEGRIVSAMMSIDVARRWDGLRSASNDIARDLRPEDLAALAHRSDLPPSMPPDFRPGQRPQVRQVAWNGFWRETLTEIFLQGRERSVPALRAVAFGPAGTAQNFAFPILCRFAALGVERDRFFDDLRRAFPAMPQDFQMLVVDSLKRQGIGVADRAIGREMHRDSGYAAEVERLKELPGFREAEEALLSLDGEE
jgi:hypothetical protein